MNKGYPNIVYDDLKIGEALLRYLKYLFGFEKAYLNPLRDPFRFRDAVEMAEKSDFLLVDAFIDGGSIGFQFARQIGKKILLLFYSGELDIKHEGSFWLELPYKLNRLGEKIKEIMSQTASLPAEYEKLEERYPALRESKGHHG